ncbi:ABC transporter permease [bacterium]|nr:ABC transporter permease [bacterium]
MIKIAFRSIWAQKARSILVAIGVAIGVIAVGGMTTAALSIQSGLHKQLSMMGTNTFTVMRISPFMFMPGAGGNRKKWREMWRRPKLEISYLPTLKEGCPSCEKIAPFIKYPLNNTVSLGKNKLDDTTVLGVVPDYNGITNVTIGFGRFFDDNDIQHRRYVCIIGQTVLNELFKGANPIGRKIKLRGIPFTIIGVSNPIGKVFGQDNDNFVLTPITTALHHWHGWWGIMYLVKAKPKMFQQAIDEVTITLRNLRNLKGSDENNFDILTQDMLMRMFNVILGAVYAVGVGIALMSLLVAGIGIMNVMFVSVSERTKEIGIRKACGATPKNIMLQFTIEAAIIALIGGLVGMSIIYGLILLFGRAVPFEISLNITVLLFGLFFSAGAGVIFGFFPARKAAKLPPVYALRWE